MQEPLLHFAWRFQLFGKHTFALEGGQHLRVIFPGYLNANQGPDFLCARLDISGVLWVGAVELHLDSRDWYAHEHHRDPVYNAVVLHVVLRSAPQKPLRNDGTEIPELVVAIPEDLDKRYSHFLNEKNTILCRNFYSKNLDIVTNQWFTNLGIERLERKRVYWEAQKSTDTDYLELLWQATAMAIAGPVNQQPFQEAAQLVPFSLIRRYQGHPTQVSALLYGITRLLPQCSTDNYIQKLIYEWHFLQEKHQLKKVTQSSCYFFRIRPPAFPTIRLAQLAALVQYAPYWQLSSLMLSINTELISQDIHSYWKNHYVFEKITTPHSVCFTNDLSDLIQANARVPVQLAYFSSMKPEMIPTLLGFLEQVSPEKNRFVKYFETLNFTPKSMLQTQGIVECVTQYCQHKRCLDCLIGQNILRLT